MTLPKLRSWLYWLAKLFGDHRAIKTGRIAERHGWRITSKLAGRSVGQALALSCTTNGCARAAPSWQLVECR